MGGRDKARLRLHAGGPTFIELLITGLRPLVQEIILAGRSDQDFSSLGCRMLVDRLQDAGPVCGLESALQHCTTPWVYLTACDMPFFSDVAFTALARRRSAAPIVMPRDAQGCCYPTMALYHTRLATELRAYVDAGERSLIGFVHRVNATFVEPEPTWGKALCNINTH